VPLNAIWSGDPGALLEIDRLPVALVAVLGEKVTPKVTVWLGFSV
jgi:hypothetical protein